jgi:hypothetical protein
MRHFLFLTTTSLLCLTNLAHSQPAKKPDLLFDFKGIRLETPLEEFRTLPHPDGSAARVVCTGEEVGKSYKSEPIDVRIYSEDERAAGIVKCVWINTSDEFENTSGLDLAGSGYATFRYSFEFVKDPKDGTMRLFKYSGKTNINAANDINSALTAKWGKPIIKEGSVQSQAGATFPQVTAIWSNSLSFISTETRFTKIDDMGIVMVSNRLSSHVKSMQDARKASIKNGI